MKSSIILERLSEITKVLIKENIDYLELKPALDDYKSLLTELAGLDFDGFDHRDNIYLDSGKAIATEWAVRCIDDILRTKQFINGIYHAVLDVRKEKTGQPVYILYAGTGPFATLVLPLITLFDPSEIQFIMLEINPVSMNCVRETISKFDASAYVDSFHLCDAVTFKLDANQEVDIILTECLQHALAREPQVSIVFNLLHQLPEKVVLIPEDISLHIGLIDSGLRQKSLLNTQQTESPQYYENSEPVFSLNKRMVYKKINGKSDYDLHFPEVKVLFDTLDFKQYNEIAIHTEITIYKQHRLTNNQSGLTIPLTLKVLYNSERPKGIMTQYIVSDIPELKTTFIN